MFPIMAHIFAPSQLHDSLGRSKNMDFLGVPKHRVGRNSFKACEWKEHGGDGKEAGGAHSCLVVSIDQCCSLCAVRGAKGVILGLKLHLNRSLIKCVLL